MLPSARLSLPVVVLYVGSRARRHRRTQNTTADTDHRKHASGTVVQSFVQGADHAHARIRSHEGAIPRHTGVDLYAPVDRRVLGRFPRRSRGERLDRWGTTVGSGPRTRDRFYSDLAIAAVTGIGHVDRLRYLTIHQAGHSLHVVDHANEADHVDPVDRVRRTMIVHVFASGEMQRGHVVRLEGEVI